MNTEQEVLEIVVGKLESAGIRYMVTGSIAANFYTTPRMTRDIDIIIEIRENDIDRLVPLFSDDFYVERDSIKNAFRGRGMFNVIHHKSVVKVDFIIRKDTEYRRTEFDRRRRVKFESLQITIAAPEDLILSKLEWAKDSMSEMQIGDVKNILRTVSGLDRPYIEEWVRRLNLQAIYQKAMS